ncbi:unnamed protein product [Schistosoma mattheei]|uniref:PA28_alpha domain-containing protein n=1 Tax=Schistosoma mattheei TaxID=31246 RepID=A0AA85B459_9TREM|nr:unnamed protein product [Schistosoma mattheei]
MNTEVGRLNAYKEKTKVDGEELVLNVFPKRVFEMEDILASDMFFLEGKYVHSDVNIPYPINPHNSLHPGDDMDSGLTNATDKLTNDKQQFPSKGSFVYSLPNGSVSYNKHIKAMIEKTKPCLTQLMIEAQLVRLWVQFNIPRIEDGNNFGVGIQEEILGEASVSRGMHVLSWIKSQDIMPQEGN